MRLYSRPRATLARVCVVRAPAVTDPWGPPVRVLEKNRKRGVLFEELGIEPAGVRARCGTVELATRTDAG